MDWTLRLALETDIPALEALIPLSVRALQTPFYSSAQMDAAIGTVFGVDHQLIADGTYFIAEVPGQIVGCGGWSRRKTLFGASHGRNDSDDTFLEPARTPREFVRFSSIPSGLGKALGAQS